VPHAALPGLILTVDRVVGHLQDDRLLHMSWSLLFLSAVSAARWDVRIPWLIVSQDCSLGLKPVIQRAVADALLVYPIAAHGDPFMNIVGHQRWFNTLFGAARRSLAGRR